LYTEDANYGQLMAIYERGLSMDVCGEGMMLCAFSALTAAIHQWPWQNALPGFLQQRYPSGQPA
jgi:hypothetical protein